MSMPILPRPGRRAYPPRRSKVSAAFWDNLADGRFTATQCDSCDKLTFPPRAFCAHCWSSRVALAELATRGRIYSQTMVHIAPATFAHEAPYRLCIVDLDVGIRLATRLISDAAVPIDSVVELVVLRYEDGPLFAARPVPV